MGDPLLLLLLELGELLRLLPLPPTMICQDSLKPFFLKGVELEKEEKEGHAN